jgi:pilus assembly protein Flp/PilA
MVRLLKKLHRDQTGQGMAEYGLIIALVAVIAIAAYKVLGEGVRDRVNQAADSLK